MSQDIMQPELLQRSANTAKFFALLVGINCYLPNRYPDRAFYKSLAGCVRDICLESFLKNTLQVPSAQILKLTASNTDSANLSQESPECLPTYGNIVAKFQYLTTLSNATTQNSLLPATQAFLIFNSATRY
ncbi:MAG: hypothetical protein PUP93_17670 [Rhizonema sp. NSF051]|nr:hypothetical protein [Rhizonema sp. NSF051]